MKNLLKLFSAALLLLSSSKINCDIIQIENDTLDTTHFGYCIESVETYSQDTGDSRILNVPLYQSIIKAKEEITLIGAKNLAALNIRCFTLYINNFKSILIWASNNKNKVSKLKISQILSLKIPYKKIGNFYMQKIPNKANFIIDDFFKPLEEMLKENPFFIEKTNGNLDTEDEYKIDKSKPEPKINTETTIKETKQIKKVEKEII